jgi:glycosyltransferase involved in cell wall biosynthesis
MSQDVKKDVEGFGLVFLEAAASGLPVIGSRNTGAEDAILNNQNGFLLKQDDITAISNSILKILTDKYLKERFSQSSIIFAKNSSWKKRLQKYINIYESL